MNKEQEKLFNHIKNQNHETLFSLVFYNQDTVFTVESNNSKIMFIGTGYEILKLCFTCILDLEFELIYVNNENEVVVDLKGVYM